MPVCATALVLCALRCAARGPSAERSWFYLRCYGTLKSCPDTCVVHGKMGHSLAIPVEEQGRLRIMKPDAYKSLVAQYGKHD
jgi:hypothetical protein